MSGLEDGVEKEEHYIHSEESSENPLLFMLIPGAVSCLEESTRLAGYIMIVGAVTPTVIDTAARVYRAIRGYRRN